MFRHSLIPRAGLALIAALAGCGDARPGALRLTVENAGPGTLDSVVVFTTGHQYPLGSLAPGQSRSVEVTAAGESHFEMEHGRGQRRRLNLGGYFEAGYVGSYFARVRADSVLLTRDSVRS